LTNKRRFHSINSSKKEEFSFFIVHKLIGFEAFSDEIFLSAKIDSVKEGLNFSFLALGDSIEKSGETS
jgi:hypothetical protein